MKIIKSFFLAITVAAAFLACQKELKFDDSGTSSGTFKKDGSGNCAPVTVNGIYKVDSSVNASHFVDVQVNVSVPGTFDIKSDTVNGVSFRKAGSVVFGANTIRLYASGKPIAAGTSNYTITYGISTCSFSITVLPAGATGAQYTIGGAPGACTGAIAGGTYIVGTALAPGNTLTIQVNVTIPGYYIIGASTTNGFIFSGSGVFTNAGLQNVVLTGTGTPVSAGPTAVTVTNLSSTCSYVINVQATSGPAAFTLDGAPNGCTAFALAGNYAATVAATAANTVTLNVTVQTAGTYSITTNTANGISFSGSGSLATGAQQIILTASGTPAAAGSFTFKPNVTSTCDFAVVFAAAPAPAVYTLSGAPNACAPITVNGNYNAGTALNAVTNTAIVQVNVTSIGTYTLSTNTVNGMTFSASGLFTTTGLQNVTLAGSGTPTAAATSTLTPQVGTSSCTFTVTVVAGAPAVFQCKIDGVLNTFTDQAQGTYFVPGDLLISGGKLYASFPDEFILDIDRSSVSTTVNTGIYVNTLAGSTAGGYWLSADYTDASNAFWSPASILNPSPDPFTITITTLTATRVIGTFSGTIRSNAGSGTGTKTITEGVFNLPMN